MASEKNLLDNLPYELTEGVIATTDGLHITDDLLSRVILEAPLLPELTQWQWRLVSWPDAAERLHYREGEPWCTSSDGGFTREIVCHSAKRKPIGVIGFIFGEPIKDNPLHRLAAIICEDADAFHILYDCIEEFGDE